MRATIPGMASKKRRVLDEALKLPVSDRAEVAGELLRSLDSEEPEEDPAVVEAAWADEIGRRARDLETGRVKGLTRAQARAIVASAPEKRAR
jgi:putative addiction module component (TIGR02574 family)